MASRARKGDDHEEAEAAEEATFSPKRSKAVDHGNVFNATQFLQENDEEALHAVQTARKAAKHVEVSSLLAAAPAAAPPAAKAGVAPAEAKPKLCTVKRIAPVVRAELAPGRVFAISMFSKRWVSGTTLHYFLYKVGDMSKDGAEALGPPQGRNNWLAIARRAFQWWADVGISLQFQEVQSPDNAEIRISFTQNGSSYSYVGRDNTSDFVRGQDHTMNIGWAPDRADGYGFETLVHEIGHAIGLEHEHQSPNAGIVWNEPVVLADYRQSQGWTDQEIRQQVINKVAAGSISGSKWDPASVMHYPFDGPLILQPEWAHNQGIHPQLRRQQEANKQNPPILSELDRITIRQIYPPSFDDANLSKFSTLLVGQSWNLQLSAGQQAAFKFSPTQNRKYTFTTFGGADTVLVLFEYDTKTKTEVKLAADDDSGSERNALIKVPCIAGRTYILRVRLYSTTDNSAFGVIVY